MTTTMRYDPASKSYTQLVSVTDPRTQIRIDPQMKAPYTDQFAVGADREIMNNLALAVNVNKVVSRIDCEPIGLRTGALFTSLTTMEMVSKSLSGGVPLSVTRMVT